MYQKILFSFSHTQGHLISHSGKQKESVNVFFQGSIQRPVAKQAANYMIFKK